MLNPQKVELENSFEWLLTHIGVPTHRGEGWALYHGDCVELMAQMPAASVDLTVTSPPYNIGKSYERVRDVEDYLDWCAEWLRLIYQITANSGTFWLNLGYLSVPGKARAIPIPYLGTFKDPGAIRPEMIHSA